MTIKIVFYKHVRPADELVRLYRRTKPSLIFADDDNVDKVEIGQRELETKVPTFVFGDHAIGHRNATEFFIENGSELDFKPTVIENPDKHIALIVYTTGTTGPPKCVTHSNAGILNNMNVM